MDTFIIAALTASVAIVAPAYADIDGFLKDYKLVKEYCFAGAGDYLAVGIVSEPIFTLSGITAYTRELEKALSENFGYKEVAVTFDTDLVYRIGKIGKMRIYDVIDDKRNKKALSREQIDFWIKGVVDGSVEDYQSAALLMAIAINGMSDEETFYLTSAMAESGDTVDLSAYGDRTVDKHSSGGVGDSTSFIVIPVMAALGRVCAKMSGRGLGHTGGTLDKLEAIDGVTTAIDEKAFYAQIEKTGLVIAGQTKDVCPADKILYALRDVTATVESIPLIAASIMSKKLAADLKSAEKLARLMVETGRRAGRNVSALITDMDEPLSDYIGNSLEVEGAIEVLKGNTDCPLYKVAKALCVGLLDYEGAEKDVDNAIKSGAALEKFRSMLIAQGAKEDVLDKPLCRAKCKIEIFSEKSGYVKSVDAMKAARVVLALGGGRNKKEDSILPHVGLKFNVRRGDRIEEDGLIATMYFDRYEDVVYAKDVLDAVAFSDKDPGRKDPILKIIK